MAYAKPQRMLLYNLFPLLAGPFTAWEPHLQRAARMRFNWIFVNPVQRPGRSGSLYSISDYYDFHPLLVDPRSKERPEDQAADMIRQAERLGLRMMIDLVVNHCATDSRLLMEHPAWFQWEADGKVAHPFAIEGDRKVVWEDLARFDHWNARDQEGLFQYFLHFVKYLRGLGFKGFRCDAAYQVPQDFWKRLIGEAKAVHPDLLFFAETLGCTPDQTRVTARSGFDYIFNSCKWWDFKSPWLMTQYSLTREVAPSIAFPESHDTERLFSELGGSVEGLKQRYLFAAVFSAGIMMPIGFEFGFRNKLHVVSTRPEHWEDTGLDLTSYVEAVNRIKDEDPIFQEEAPAVVFPCDNPNVLILWKGSVRLNHEVLLILNKDIRNRQHVHLESLYAFIQTRAPLVDLSPEHRLDFLPTPFSYELRPGQGILLIARGSREPAPR
ncbi:MAG: alpha-amylase family glycosyl hydrolase [bacterium]